MREYRAQPGPVLCFALVALLLTRLRTDFTAHGKGTAHCAVTSHWPTAHGKAGGIRETTSKAAAFEPRSSYALAFPCEVTSAESGEQ